jgi:hypothetical protein
MNVMLAGHTESQRLASLRFGGFSAEEDGFVVLRIAPSLLARGSDPPLVVEIPTLKPLVQ